MQTIKAFLSYIFSPSPGPQFNFYIPFIILVAILFITTIAFSVIYKNKKKEDFAFKRLFAKTSKRLLWLSFIFLFITAARYENIPYFSMRLWMYLALLLLGFFLYKTITVFKNDYPREKENVEHKMAVNKKKGTESRYLPHKNKR